MSKTAPRISPSSIDQELAQDRLIRMFKGIEIYIVDSINAPETMKEIGRIREYEFAEEGGGTGKEFDLDEFDEGPQGFKQIVAWDPEYQELIAMYRYIRADMTRGKDGEYHLPTAHLFNFSQSFKEEILPKTIELGRSVVNRRSKRKIIGLFAIWSGLGALIHENPDIEYFFGKVTTPGMFTEDSKSCIFSFWNTFYGDTKEYIQPKEQCKAEIFPLSKFGIEESLDRSRAFEQVCEYLKSNGDYFPPLMNSYLSLCSSIQSFGTALNAPFGGLYETAILVPIADINEKRKKQFIDNYISAHPEVFQWA
jgi:hypothetical protein